MGWRLAKCILSGSIAESQQRCVPRRKLQQIVLRSVCACLIGLCFLRVWNGCSRPVWWEGCEPPAAEPTISTNRTGPDPLNVYATMAMLAEGKDGAKYLQQTIMMIRNLRSFAISSDRILLLVTPEMEEHINDMQINCTFTRVPVTKMFARGTGKSYEAQVTKFHLWNLTQYKHIAYFDSDHFFLRSPEAVFEDCTADLCATEDSFLSKKHRPYLNGGFLVIRPSNATYAMLLSNIHKAENRTFAEQDMLNEVFAKQWQKMPSKWNLMWPGRLGIKNDTIAIHEKFWVLRDELKWRSDKEQPWNRFY